MTAKKCTKKRDARAELLFCQSKAIAFLPFSLLSPSSLLKLPNTVVFTLYVEARAMVGSRLSPSAYEIASPTFKLMLASLVRSKL